MTTLPDSCPRCGYALDQPAPPVAHAVAPAVAPPPPVTSYAAPYTAPYPAPSAHPPAQPSGLSAASVPKILLGLGATCLLVAAVIFLAVAWSSLGIGGRTAVLVGLTASTALAGQWLARRDLGVAAESLTVVALGLAVLDVVGARHAGWVDVPGDYAFLAVVGATMLFLSLALCLPARSLFAPQVSAPLGLGLVAIGLGLTTEHPQVLAFLAVLAFTALAVLGHVLGTVVLPWTAVTGGVTAFGAETMLALSEASEHPTWHGLWVEGHGLGLALASVLVLLPWLVVGDAPADRGEVRQLVCAVSLSMLTFTAALPVFDDGLTSITLTAAAACVVWSVVAGAASQRWYAVPRVPLAGSLLVLVPAPVALAVSGVVDLLSVGDPFTADWSVRLEPIRHLASPLLLPLAVAVVALAAALTAPRTVRSAYAVSGIAGLTVLLTAAQYPLPLAAFVAVLGPVGIVLAPPSAVLTLVCLGELTLLAAYVLVRRSGSAAATAGLVLPAALGAFLWVGGHVLAVGDDRRSLAVLVVVGLVAIAAPSIDVEVSAAIVLLASAAAGVPAASDPSVSLAVHLTLAGTVVVTSSLLHRDHRAYAWLGGALLLLATWVRLHDVGVQAPEPYTLPTALVLLAAGLHRLRRDPDAGTMTALLPGLGLATVPTLLWALEDPLTNRAVVVGAASLVLLLGGSVLRWTAPVLVGWLVGAALVLRELAPYAAETPQWVLIGTAGTILIAAGVTWEARLRDLRQAAHYLGRLR